VPTVNIFKGTPTQNPTIRRLTQFCGGANAGRPSFSGNGSQLTFWSEFPGPLKQIYVLTVGASNDFDYRFSNPHIISDGKSNDWDPLWVK
jgi:hypothetical protein